MAEFQNPRVEEEIVDDTNIFWDISSCSLVKKATIPLDFRRRGYFDSKVSCCIMPNGESVVCCNPEAAVYILNKDLTVKQKINLNPTGTTNHQPYQVAMLDNRRVVVSVPSAKLLQVISIMPTVELGREIFLKYSCDEVTCHNTNIYVSTQNLNKWSVFGCGGIEILDDCGDVIKTIQLFETPKRIFVQSDGNIIYKPSGQQYLKYVTKDSVITDKYQVIDFYSDSDFDNQGHMLQFDDDKICVHSIDGQRQKVVLQGAGATTQGKLEHSSASKHGKLLMHCCLLRDIIKEGKYIDGIELKLYTLDY